ncbi:hypothetical protein Q3G72_023419 [Acer saccharum]|nr:hypothetical protein Q3G72_023419 [Acer saccharum]
MQLKEFDRNSIDENEGYVESGFQDFLRKLRNSTTAPNTAVQTHCLCHGSWRCPLLEYFVEWDRDLDMGLETMTPLEYFAAWVAAEVSDCDAHMMYCFGDDANPLPETVALVEDIVVEYVTDLAHKAQDMGSKRGKLTVEDFLYQIRKDFPKLNRCRELLSMQEEVKQAKKAFEMDVEKLASIE